MVAPRLFNRLGLCLFDEARIAEPGGKAVALLLRYFSGFGQARAFGGKVDDPVEREREGRFIDHDLSGRPFDG